MSVSVPAERYSDIIGKEKFNIAAKSVGTGVAKDFEKGRLFVVQNEKDPLGSFERIKFNRCQRRARLF